MKVEFGNLGYSSVVRYKPLAEMVSYNYTQQYDRSTHSCEEGREMELSTYVYSQKYKTRGTCRAGLELKGDAFRVGVVHEQEGLFMDWVYWTLGPEAGRPKNDIDFSHSLKAKEAQSQGSS